MATTISITGSANHPRANAARDHYYDETDLMAVRVDAWKMHIGVKPKGSWWTKKHYSSVPYIFNLLMGSDGEDGFRVRGVGYVGRKFVGQKLWAPTAASPFLGAIFDDAQAISSTAGRGHAERSQGDRKRDGQVGRRQDRQR